MESTASRIRWSSLVIASVSVRALGFVLIAGVNLRLRVQVGNDPRAGSLIPPSRV